MIAVHLAGAALFCALWVTGNREIDTARAEVVQEVKRHLIDEHVLRQYVH